MLDEFHEFTMTKTGKPRPKQSLLYNLFEASVRLAIIGITPFLDVTDLLEKRIRSRISHRKIMFTGCKYEEVMLILKSSREAFISISFRFSGEVDI